MEPNPPAPENSDQIVLVHTTTDEQQEASTPTSQAQAQAQARSYECNFCKRGFSNAQALGGHMNIHRKDKAKLKQTTTSTQPLQNPNFYSPKKEEKVIASKLPNWIFSDTHMGGQMQMQMQKLPLFEETASNKEANQDRVGNIGKEKELSSSHEHEEPELDLELRLGHQPQESLTPKGMKKFL